MWLLSRDWYRVGPCLSIRHLFSWKEYLFHWRWIKATKEQSETPLSYHHHHNRISFWIFGYLGCFQHICIVLLLCKIFGFFRTQAGGALFRSYKGYSDIGYCDVFRRSTCTVSLLLLIHFGCKYKYIYFWIFRGTKSP